jgi:archaellum biogenesis ATPase FlaH
MDLQILKQQYSEAIYRHFFPSWGGNGKNTHCFSHKDGNPSLSIFQKNGEYRHHCHACGISGDSLDIIGQLGNISDTRDKISRFKEIAGIAGVTSKKKIVKTYDYTSAEGEFIFQVLRYMPKGFSQRRPDPDNKGRWIYDLKGVQLIPYNLPAIVKSPYCFICEGERDCETLRNIGLASSTCPMGAGKWREEYNQFFKGKRIYIIGDNDKPGRDHALQVAKSLKGVAESIKVIELPGLPEKGDVSDWIAQGNTKEMLVELCKNAPEWTPTKMSEQDKSVASQNCLPEDKNVGTPQEAEQGKAEKPLLSSLLRWNDILSLDVKTEYLLDKLIPKGSITLLFGRGGAGKTSLCLQMCRAIAEGLPFGDLQTTKTAVYYVDFENPLAVLKERVESIGKTDSVYIWHLSSKPQPPRLDMKEWALYKQLPPGLLIFDTLRAAHLSDENSSLDMAVVISRLKELREAGFTILLLHHTPKGNDGIYKGSTALLDLVDHCISLEQVNRDEEPIEFDSDNLYRLGVRIKTRYEPHHIFLKFNPKVKGFEIAKDPDVERIEAIYEILKGSPEGLKQKSFKEKIKSELDLTEPQIRRLLKKGEGMAWDVQRGGSGKENRALIYTPKFDRMIGQPIYSHPIIPSNPERDKSLSNQALLNSQQIIDNACLADRIDSVQPINTTNHSINTSNRCSGCLLTPKMRLLCEVKKPCPKGVIE